MHTITTLPRVTIRFEDLDDIKGASLHLLWLTCGATNLCCKVGSGNTSINTDKQTWERTRSELRDLHYALATWLNDASVLRDDKFRVPLTDVEASYGFAAHEIYRYLFDVDGMLCCETAQRLHRLISTYLTLTNTSSN